MGAEARCVGASFILNRSCVSTAMLFQSVPMQAPCTTSRICPAAPPATRRPPTRRRRAERRRTLKPVRAYMPRIDSVLLNATLAGAFPCPAGALMPDVDGCK